MERIKIYDDMKKGFSLLSLVIAVLTSCGNKEISHPIVNHTYFSDTISNWKYTFYDDGTYSSNWLDDDIHDLTYTIKHDSIVTLYYQKTVHHKKEVIATLIYESDKDILHLQDESWWKYINSTMYFEKKDREFENFERELDEM